MIMLATVEFAVLFIGFEAVVLAVLAAVHFDEGCSVAAVEAGMLTNAEFIEFKDHFV